jgi:uncharacterized membrane protein
MKPYFLNEDFDLMVDNSDNYRLGIFYFNRRDKRAVVPKRNRMLGWMVNFAHPYAYWWMTGIIALIIFAAVMSIW